MRSIRLVSFNILHGQRGDGSGTVDLDLLVRSVEDLRPDVLALQEVDVGVPRSGRADEVRLVGEALGLEAVFGKAARVGGIGKYGNALLARGSITDVEVISLPKTARRHEPRSAILAMVEVAGVRFFVCATHLSIHRPEVHHQLDVVVDALDRRDGRAVLMGDLNLLPEEVAPAVERAGLCIADTTLPTFPRELPQIRIDHVCVRDLAIERVEVVTTASSDHCALAVEVRI